MRTSLVVAPLVLAAAALCCADTVADSCNAIRDFADVAFCVSRLRSVPGAASAARHGHLVMAADLAAAMRDALRACAFLYGAASVPALRIMRGYAAARGWGAAHSLFMLARQAGGDCDAALGGAAGRTMAAANREFDQLAIVTTALLNTFSL